MFGQTENIVIEGREIVDHILEQVEQEVQKEVREKLEEFIRVETSQLYMNFFSKLKENITTTLDKQGVKTNVNLTIKV